MIELILIILVILAIVGISIFTWIDYNKHKTSNETDFKAVDTNLKEEKETRLSNLKYVVDQVNKTNEDMDKTYVQRFNEVDAGIKKYTAFESGFGSLITARNRSSNVDIPITNLATLPATDINMIKHVSFLGGATIKDLQNDATKDNMRVQFCGTGTNPACIKLPDAAGDTYLTSLVAGKSIVFDAPVKNYNSLGMYASPTDTTPTLSLKAGANGQTDLTMSATGKLVVKTSDTTPIELVNIEKANTTVKNTVTLQNSAGTKTATLMVNADGDLNIIASKVKVNGVEVPAVVATTTPTSVTTTPTSVTTTPTSVTTTPIIAPVQEPFCTATANQGKNFQCTDSASPLKDKYFKIENSARREYQDWTQAFNNSTGSLVADTLTNCSELASCTVGSIIPRV